MSDEIRDLTKIVAEQVQRDSKHLKQAELPPTLADVDSVEVSFGGHVIVGFDYGRYESWTFKTLTVLDPVELARREAEAFAAHARREEHEQIAGEQRARRQLRQLEHGFAVLDASGELRRVRRRRR